MLRPYPEETQTATADPPSPPAEPDSQPAPEPSAPPETPEAPAAEIGPPAAEADEAAKAQEESDRLRQLDEAFRDRESRAAQRAAQSERDRNFAQQRQDREAEQRTLEVRKERQLARSNRVTEFIRGKGYEDVDAQAVSSLLQQDDEVTEKTVREQASASYTGQLNQWLETSIGSQSAFGGNRQAITDILQRPTSSGNWVENAPEALVELGRREERTASEARLKVAVERGVKAELEALSRAANNSGDKQEPKEVPQGSATPSGTDDERLDRIADGQPQEGDQEWYEGKYGRSSRRR